MPLPCEPATSIRYKPVDKEDISILEFLDSKTFWPKLL